MGSTKSQIEIKNRALSALNHTTGNVYDLQTKGGTTAQQIVANKSHMAPGNVPTGFWSEEMKITKKDWKVIAVAIALTALMILILLRTKIINL